MVGGLVALSLTGLPLPHHADHDAEVAHVEHGHGGHGTLLLQQDERLLTKTVDVSAPAAATPAFLSSPVVARVSPTHGPSLPHPGRDPPGNSRPRAPPALTS